MRIKEVENKLHITRANIRYYEKEGLLEPKRNEKEYRDYSEEDIERLEKIILFRKCNISIENIRLIFNGTKTVNEVFEEQIRVIEKEIKTLEGAKIICNELAHDKSSIDDLNTDKYINMMLTEQQKGHKFYDIAEDYILTTEKLYQSLIEKDGISKKSIRKGLYVAHAVLTFVFLILIDFAFRNMIEWDAIIMITLLFSVADFIGVKKYIENKTGEKLTQKQNIKHYVMTLIIALVALLGYQSINYIYNVNKEPNNNVLEMSVKKSLIDIANDQYKNNGNYTYAENHTIHSTEIKNNSIYVYVTADYGLFENDGNKLKSINSRKSDLTLIYTNHKDKNGIYGLKSYKEKVISKDR